MSESNNNTPMRITQLEEATSYSEGAYLPIAKAGYGTKKISVGAASPALLQFEEWENEIEVSLAYNERKRVFFYANKGDIIKVESTAYSSNIFFTLIYTDGTNQNLRLPNKLYFRIPQNISAVEFYSQKSSTETITVSKYKEIEYITNYYNKATKQEGYITGATIASGYYHTDFIPAVMGESIIFSGYPSTFGTVYLYFYDENKTYLGRSAGTLRDDGLYQKDITASLINVVLSSANVKYVAFNMSVAGSETAVCYKEKVPYSSAEYGQHIPEDEELFFNEIQKEFIGNSGGQPIAGKKIAYNGDSICEGRYTGNAQNGGAYAQMIADLTGGTFENRAIGGGILCSAAADGASVSRKVCTDVSNMAADADLICFEGGINDYWHSNPLGDYSESDYSGTLDTTTICGALESIFRQATNRWVGKPIVFVIVHKITSTVYLPNSAGYTFTQAREKMIGICKKYAIPYFDAFAESGLNAYNSIQNQTFLTANSSGTPDGCHPNAEGYKKYYVPQLIALFNSVIPRN